MKPQPTLRAGALFVAALILGGAAWLALGPALNPLYAAILQSVLSLLHGQAFAGAAADGKHVILQSNLIAPEAGNLLGARIEPLHFTLAMPLVWASIMALAPPRVWPRWLLLASLIALGSFLIALAMQAGVALPRWGLRAGVEAMQGGTPLEPRRLAWSGPSADLLAAIDLVRIALVHFNLFVLPPLLAVLAWRSATRPVAAEPVPVRHGPRRSRKR